MLQGCKRALMNARPGSKVSCVPGLEAVTEKRRLATTLRAAYGEGAFAIIPRTYLLPEEYWRWRLSLGTQVRLCVCVCVCVCVWWGGGEGGGGGGGA